MNEKHYKEQLSAFVNHELAADERQALAEHLLLCAECRAEHDRVKLGAALAGQLRQSDAPENLWNKIENSLDSQRSAAKTSLPATNFTFFSLRGMTAAAAVLMICGLIYLGVFRQGAPEIVSNEPPARNADLTGAPTVSTPNEIAAIQDTNKTPEAVATNDPAPTANLSLPNPPPTAASNVDRAPDAVRPKTAAPVRAVPPSWSVETLAGMPRIGNSFESEKIAVGEILETDANSRARVQVADIGDVEVAPNSRVKLVNTNRAEHRLALEKGTLKAKIFAPPRLFIVDTPSGAAVDLGCEYTLEVDQAGNSRLHVTSGYVALENGKYESIVPAGALAVTRKGKGVGTPFSEDASQKLQDALYKFDFENGGGAALRTIIDESGLYDSVTLWHLLSRVDQAERAGVFDALSAQVKPPSKVTRDGILKLDKKMLDAWWSAIETVWFE